MKIYALFKFDVKGKVHFGKTLPLCWAFVPVLHEALRGHHRVCTKTCFDEGIATKNTIKSLGITEKSDNLE